MSSELYHPPRLPEAAAAASAVLAAGARPDAHAAGSDEIRVGIVGCGGRGTRRRRQRPALAAKGVKIVALGRRLRGPKSDEPAATGCTTRLAQGRAASQGARQHASTCRRPLLRRPGRLQEGDQPRRQLHHPGHAARASARCTSRRPSPPARTSSPRSRSPWTAPASARCWPPTRRPRRRSCSIVAGTQRRHQTGYIETMKRDPRRRDRRHRRRARATGTSGIWFQPRASRA